MTAVVGPTGVKWVDWLIAIGVIATTIGLLWKKVLKPLIESISVAVDIAPVLGFVPDENGKRTTLRDSLHEIVDAVSDVKTAVSTIVDVQQTQGEKIDQLHEYAHDTRHEQRGQITALVLSDELLSTKLDALNKRVAEGVGATQRIEAAQSVVAEDLAAAVGRADAVEGAEGAAADAASRSPDDPEST